MTVSHPVEVELKLALPPPQVAAFLKLMARRRGVQQQLEFVTRYYDTPDFALSLLGVSLRVRRIGRRWLQTIKTEGERHGGLSQRVEYEMPVARGMPDWSRFPAEALALVPEALRVQLVPVFETRFKRTAWLVGGLSGAKIEVALDVGEVHTLKDTCATDGGVNAGERRQQLCEIELELKAGQPDALFELAQGWAAQLGCMPFDVSKAERGVRLACGQADSPVKSVPLGLSSGMSVEDGFAAIVQVCLAQFQANLPGVLDSTDIEYVHQARVALRRLRAALRLYRKACVLPDALMEGLRNLAGALGPARDWDVLCGETLPAIAPHYQDEAGWQTGAAVLEVHRAGVRADMQVALRQAAPGAWLLAFQRWLLQRGWRAVPAGGKPSSGGVVPEAQRFVQLSPLKKWARQALQKGYRPIVRGARVFAELQPLQRHALRIAIKRQRYAAEFFQTLFAGRRQAQYLDMLREAQDSLGRSNDARVAWELLTNSRMDTGPVGQFVLGWLAARQAQGSTEDIAGQLQDFVKFTPYW